MSVIQQQPSPTAQPDGRRERTPRRAALASFMGSAVEYYDFFVFGSAAALIFPKVFFPDGDDNARWSCRSRRSASPTSRGRSAPFVLGHFGDRIGRQKVLMFTLVLMGAVDLRDRLPADVRHRRLARRPCCWCCADCCRASPPPASRPAPAP